MNKDEFEEFQKYCRRQDRIRFAVISITLAIMWMLAGIVLYIVLSILGYPC